MKIYQVGGCVRDKLLRITPQDFDFVVVGATPLEMTNLGFKQKSPNFPVFLHPQTKQEYTLARKDIKTGPKHTDFKLIYTPDITLQQDLIRRDFTCNAIAFDEEQDLYIDPFNGIADIKSQTLKCVAPQTFNEDPLRVIRMCRFSAQLDFTIDEQTMQIAQTNEDICHLSRERIWQEIHKALHYPSFWRFVESFYSSKAWEKFFNIQPEDITSILEEQKLAAHNTPQQKWQLCCSSCPELLSLPCSKKYRQF